MRIEVLVGSSEPIIYPLNKPRIVVGSSDNSDVILSTEGVSRKHLLITHESDRFFVTDQGSTNGTFINEERLVPGRKVEFTSFFPVRLGEDVLITLLSDDEISDFAEGNKIVIPARERTSPNLRIKQDPEATRTIKLTDLKPNQTETLVKKRQEKRTIAVKNRTTKTNPKPQKKKEKGSSLGIFATLLLGAAVVYHFYFKEPAPEEVPIQKVGQIVMKKVEPVEVKVPTHLLSVSDLTDRESLSRLMNDLKCVTDMEKYLCESIPGANQDPWGVTQVGTTLNVMIDATPYMSEAKKIIGKTKIDTQEEKDNYYWLVRKVAAFIFLKKYVPEQLDSDLLKDTKITFGLFTKVDENFVLEIAIGILPEGLKKFQQEIKFEQIKRVHLSGLSALDLTKMYYHTY